MKKILAILLSLLTLLSCGLLSACTQNSSAPIVSTAQSVISKSFFRRTGDTPLYFKSILRRSMRPQLSFFFL